MAPPKKPNNQKMPTIQVYATDSRDYINEYDTFPSSVELGVGDRTGMELPDYIEHLVSEDRNTKIVITKFY